MPHEDEQADRPPEHRPPEQSDQLSPNQALRQSLGRSSSQRVGDSGPVANPTVSFPAEPGAETAGETDGG